MSQLRILLLLLMLTSVVQAEDLSLRTTIEEKKNLLTGSFENTTFKTDQGNIEGMGLRASFEHWMNKNYSIEFAASVAMNNQSGVQSNSFTGFNIFGHYAILGQPYSSLKKNYLGDKLIATELLPLNSCISIGVGVSQYFLNGKRGVYSASGLGAGLGYTTHFWGFDWKAAVNWTQLQASELKVNGLSYDVGLTFLL